MQPQRNIFNAGVWADMEGQLRKKWNTNKFRDRLYVAKGGTIDNTMQTLGTTSSGLIIPRYFFMAILCEYDNGQYKALGFWIEHKNSDQSRDLSQYVVNIDRLEELTGIDFFCNLPDEIEDKVESTSRSQVLKDWDF
jgi:endonuclease G